MSYVVQQDTTFPKFYGGAYELWHYKGKEVVLGGPFETGKTYAALTKFHALSIRYPGAQSLMVRQTYKSCLSSACMTYENKVLPYPPSSPKSGVTKYGGQKAEFYIYPNGSRIWVGGLDHPDKFLSAEFDFIYVNQVEEISKSAWETLGARATGRAGNAPYTQIIGDCNPAYPGHWILQRMNAGHLKLLEQLHIHNPMLYDPRTGEITEQGVKTMGELNRLTGIRKERGLYNRWVAAEGVIYDNFSLTDNVTTDAEYNPNLDVYWGVDDGYAHGGGEGTAGFHPRAIVLCQVQDDGSIYVFDEYYRTLQLPEATIKELLEQPYHIPQLAKVDSSAAELRRRLHEAGIMSGGATHRVVDGIKVVRRFICDGNGVRLLKIHPRCKHLIRELQTYRYDDKGNRVEAGEPKPLKMDDHLTDALRYIIWNFR